MRRILKRIIHRDSQGNVIHEHAEITVDDGTDVEILSVETFQRCEESAKYVGEGRVSCLHVQQAAQFARETFAASTNAVSWRDKSGSLSVQSACPRWSAPRQLLILLRLKKRNFNWSSPRYLTGCRVSVLSGR